MRCAVSLRTSHFVPRTYLQPIGQGTGLGLSLSSDIIKAHQGKIE
jgi:signal transduction histidine kinase